MTPVSLTVQCFVDFRVDETGRMTVHFTPRDMDRDFFAHADVNGRTVHPDEYGVEEPATDEEWDAIEAGFARVEEVLQSGEPFEVFVISPPPIR